MLRQSIGSAIQRLIGQRPVATGHRYGLRVPPHLRFETRRETALVPRSFRLAGPMRQQRCPFLMIQQRQVADAGVRPHDKTFQDALEVPDHPEDRLRIKQPAVVGELESQFLARPAHDRHGIVRVDPILLFLGPEHDPPFAERRVDRRVLEHEQAVKEGFSARNFAAALNLNERGIFVLTKPDVLRQQILEPGQHRLFGQDRDPQRQGIDEQPQHRFDTQELRRTTGHRDPEQYVPLSAVICEQDRPGPLHEGVGRHAMLLCQGCESRCQVGTQVNAMVRRIVVLIGQSLRRAVVGERRGCGEVAQVVAPKPVRVIQILFLQPGDIVPIGPGLLRPADEALSTGLVVGQEIHQQGRNAPLVEQDVVETMHELIGAIGQADQPQVHERRLAEVEPLFQFLLQQGVKVGHLLRAVLPLPVHDIERNLDLLVYGL